MLLSCNHVNIFFVFTDTLYIFHDSCLTYRLQLRCPMRRHIISLGYQPWVYQISLQHYNARELNTENLQAITADVSKVYVLKDRADGWGGVEG